MFIISLEKLICHPASCWQTWHRCQGWVQRCLLALSGESRQQEMTFHNLNFLTCTHSLKDGHATEGSQFNPPIGHGGTKWDKSGTLKISFLFILALWAENWSESILSNKILCMFVCMFRMDSRTGGWIWWFFLFAYYGSWWGHSQLWFFDWRLH